MKNEMYPKIRATEVALVMLGWAFLNFRGMDKLVKFPGSYLLISGLLSLGIMIWLKKKKNYHPTLFCLDRKHLPFLVLCIGAVVLLILTGLVFGSITLNFNWFKLLMIPAVFIGIYLSIGLVEELVFRQTVLVFFEQRWGAALALIVSSLLFGFSHIVRGQFPNWPYVLLATLAGLLYGAIFRRGGLGYAALMHSIVDVMKYAFFSH